MTNNTINSASVYFNANWNRYINAVNANTLYHREMFAELRKFIEMHFSTAPFNFVDIGCGDSHSVAQVLVETAINKYIGVDAAKDVLKLAALSLENVHCDKELICEDMVKAIPHLARPIDIIFTSYAVHHLSTQQKFDFILSCQQKLEPNRFFIMVDVVLNPNQTRDEWLQVLRNRMQTANPDIDKDEIDLRMNHAAADDHPDSVETFRAFAEQQKWADFQLVLQKEIFAFMVFRK